MRWRLLSSCLAALLLLALWHGLRAPQAEVDLQRDPLTGEQRASFIEANDLLARREPKAARRARKLLAELTEAAPAHAPAILALARALLFIGELGAPLGEAYGASKRAAMDALRLQESAAGHAILGHIQFGLNWNFQAAAREFEQALELDPKHALTRLGLGAFLARTHAPCLCRSLLAVDQGIEEGLVGGPLT